MIIFGDVTEVFVHYAEHLKNGTFNETEEIDKLFAGVTDFAIYACTSGVVMIVTTYLAGIFFSYSALRQVTVNSEKAI